MSDLERLHEIIDNLPQQQVHALLTLLESARPIDEEEFALRLAGAPEEEVDEETVARSPAQPRPAHMNFLRLKAARS